MTSIKNLKKAKKSSTILFFRLHERVFPKGAIYNAEGKPPNH
jgi:hypothetical protein